MNTFIFKSYIGEDTEVVVDFDYRPSNPPVLNPIERAHPGNDEEITINAVWVNHKTPKIDDLLDSLNEETLERLSLAAGEYVRSMAE